MCLFCQIIKKELPSEIVYEDEYLVVFKDIHPQAPVHLLLVPRKHVASIAEMKIEDKILSGEVIYRAKLLAEEFKIAKSGYKLVTNTGQDGGQIIAHLHFHLLGGKPLKGLI